MSTGSQTSKIQCPHCGAMIRSLGLAAGSAVNCPKCGNGFRIGEGAGGSGFGVQGSEEKGTGDRGQGTGGRVQGSKFKVQSQPKGVPVPPPPPPDQRVGTSPAEQNAQAQTANSQSVAPNPISQIPKTKSAKPDVLVDPNLLPPPPPRVKEKAKEVAVVCRLCGTRTYAPLEKIGQTVKCPDCHTRNEVPGVKEAGDRGRGTGDGGQGTEKPTLEGAEEFQMSEVVERPKYRPLQAARGEYEVLSALDPAAMEYRLTAPGERPRSKTATVETENETGEISLAPVEERAEAARDPRSILPQPEMEPENELYDGRYDDGVIGDNVDPRSPDAWKRAPMLYGIVEFVFYPSTLPRWLTTSVLLVMVVLLGRFTITFAMSDGLDQLLGLLGILFFIPTCAIWVVHFSAMLLAIVQDTGSGGKEVTEWPEWNFFEWFASAAYLPVAGVISMLPGAVLGGLVFFGS